MPTIYIDDQAYEVPEGDNVLQACLSAGIDLPYFCWHPAMGSVGACRQCALVQYRDAEDTRGRIVMGCMTPVADGARFSMKGETASEFRESVVESLMLNHPHDCPVCAEGGECHLQDMTVMVGHRDRRYRGMKNTHRNQDLGPLVHHEMNRCISCYRCTRFYNDYAGGTDLSAQGAHDHVYFGRQEDGVLESEFAGNLVEVCPTGVFTDKPLVNEYTRKWDLQSAPSICSGCALGCNTMPGERYGKLKRTHNRYNSEVNGYFLCDRGRYGGAYVNDESRATFAGQRNSANSYDAIESDRALALMREWCAPEQKVAAIGSPRASLESNFLLGKLVGANNYCNGMADYESSLVQDIVAILSAGSVSTPGMMQVETADAVLVLGEDVTNTAPRLALSLRQSVRNRSLEMADELRIPHWQDEAVRVLAQDQLSPLFIAAMADTPLDDVAEATLRMSPADIARLGFAIAAELDSSLPGVDNLDDQSQQEAKRIAEALRNAKRPLVISGVACQSAEVISAAAQIAHALKNSEAMLSYCVPEANSLGSALMSNGDNASFAELTQRADKGDIDTLVVLENDLYRRAPREQVDALLKGVKNLVVLDVIENDTFAQANLVLPTASTVESEGTLVSSEGRAQRHYPVYLPAEQTQAAWQWLSQLGQSLQLNGFDALSKFDDVCAACAAEIPALAAIEEASPNAEYRNRGLKIPRQTHRYSGRTAMRADISLHEPKQPEDNDSPLAFTMEGANDTQPGSLLPFVWSPGWNSNQSLHKFQSEVGGALQGGTAGVRLIEHNGGGELHSDESIPPAFSAQYRQWTLLPLYRIFGSDELSARAPAVNELISRPFIHLNEADANNLHVQDGDGILCPAADAGETFEVNVNDAIPIGCAGYSHGLPGVGWIAPGTSIELRKDAAWQRHDGGGSDD